MTRIFGLIRWGLMTAAVSLATCLAVQALAQTFPERTVKLIVPVPPLLIGGFGTLAIGPSVKTPDCNRSRPSPPSAPYHRDHGAGGKSQSGADTLDAFLRYAKVNGGKLNYGSAPGIIPHFVSELFNLKTAARSWAA